MDQENKDQESDGHLKGLKLLRQPFAKNHISLLPRPTKKENEKGKCNVCGGWHGLPAVHLEYVGHAALTDRLLDADAWWSWEPLALTPEGLPRFDESGGLWIKLTVCGVTRLGYGHAESSEYKDIGSREKEVIGDALRNAAMRFGAALDLWHKGDLHAATFPKDKIPEAARQEQSNDPGDFVINFTKDHKGKKLKEMKDQDLTDLMNWCVAKKKMPEFQDAVRKFYKNAPPPSDFGKDVEDFSEFKS